MENNIGNSGAISLGTALKTNSSLTWLVLGGEEKNNKKGLFVL